MHLLQISQHQNRAKQNKYLFNTLTEMWVFFLQKNMHHMVHVADEYISRILFRHWVSMRGIPSQGGGHD